MYKRSNKNNLIAYPLIVGAITIAFTLPWIFSALNSSGNYYGLYVDKPAYTFNLTDTKGEKVSLENLSGSYVYLMFGFTHCQGTCPPQLGNMLRLNKHTGDKAVRFAFITLDPDRDTGEYLKQYFETQGDNFIALRPESFTQSQELALQYHEYAYLEGQNKNSRDYQINHNGYIYLLDPEGVLKLIYTSAQLNYSEMLEDLNKLYKPT
jgi:protein SCO1/2